VNILVDADSCPAGTRRVILKAAEKRRIKAFFAANRAIPEVEGDFAMMVLCPERDGSADDCIAALAEQGDVAVTRDVPLAERLIRKGASVLDDRGGVFTPDNIRARLSVRDFKIGLALNGTAIERTANYGRRELKLFADSFDRLLTAASRAAGDGGTESFQRRGRPQRERMNFEAGPE
jgi:uncharacterized protein YaiI (UPF0178 family)